MLFVTNFRGSQSQVMVPGCKSNLANLWRCLCACVCVCGSVYVSVGLCMCLCLPSPKECAGRSCGEYAKGHLGERQDIKVMNGIWSNLKLTCQLGPMQRGAVFVSVFVCSYVKKCSVLVVVLFCHNHYSLPPASIHFYCWHFVVLHLFVLCAILID